MSLAAIPQDCCPAVLKPGSEIQELQQRARGMRFADVIQSRERRAWAVLTALGIVGILIAAFVSLSGRSPKPFQVTVGPYLTPDGIERTASPEIGRLDVVVGVCVKDLVGGYELIELMNEQEDGRQSPRVVHECVQRSVISVVSKPKRVVRAVGR